VRGVLENPLLAIAEVLDIVGALLQVILIATIHECAPRRAKNLASLGECLAPANRIAYDQICATVRAQLVDSLALVVPAAAGTWATARRWIALSARQDERFLTRAIDRV